MEHVSKKQNNVSQVLQNFKMDLIFLGRADQAVKAKLKISAIVLSILLLRMVFKYFCGQKKIQN